MPPTPPPFSTHQVPQHTLKALWTSCELVRLNGKPLDEAVLHAELLERPGLSRAEQQALLDAGLLISRHGAFTLSQKGLTALQSLSPAGSGNSPDQPRPCWNRNAGVLSFDGQLVKYLDERAKIQIRLLNAFTADDWAREVPNPFTGKGRAKRLRDAARYLNWGQKLLEFDTLKEGTRACWKAIPEPVGT